MYKRCEESLLNHTWKNSEPFLKKKSVLFSKIRIFLEIIRRFEKIAHFERKNPNFGENDKF